MKQILFPDKNPVSQLGFTILLTLSVYLLVLFLATLAGRFIFGVGVMELANTMDFNNPSLLGLYKYYQIVLSIGLFIIPPLLLAWLFSGKPAAYLLLNHKPALMQVAVVLFIMIMAIPAINFFAYWNTQIRLPGYLSNVEQYFIHAEKVAEEQTAAFLKIQSIQGLLFNIFMIGMLPAIGEELMFRGILQRLLSKMTRNVHWGIILSSFFFSAIHFQFYGLFPRWILGIFFGYMLVWSGSLWLPMLAHFVNNTVAVLGRYSFDAEKMDGNATDFGSAPGMFPFAILSLLLVIAGFYILYRKREKLVYP
jgi:uncharacterized protein